MGNNSVKSANRCAGLGLCVLWATFNWSMQLRLQLFLVATLTSSLETQECGLFPSEYRLGQDVPAWTIVIFRTLACHSSIEEKSSRLHCCYTTAQAPRFITSQKLRCITLGYGGEEEDEVCRSTRRKKRVSSREAVETIGGGGLFAQVRSWRLDCQSNERRKGLIFVFSVREFANTVT